MRGTINSRRRALMVAAFLLALLLLMIPACGRDRGDGVVLPFTTVLFVGSPRTDAVAFFGFNYYSYYSAPVTPGALYQISITGLTDVLVTPAP